MVQSLYRYLLNHIPRPLLIRLSYLFKYIAPLFLSGNRFEDPIDGKTYRKLLPYGYGIQRPNALSPSSHSLERHRLLWLYLQNETDFFSKKRKLLHVAPEQCFLGRFRKMKNLEYVTADIESPIADVKLDVQEMPFEDGHFDMVLCNHVLEHVPDDRKAMREIKRVLKPDGLAIMQVPQRFDWEKTMEDPSITDRAERERLFGQYDHLRMYGMDYPQRLQEEGFEVEVYDISQKLSAEQFERFALPKGEMLYVCRHPQ
jgi:SAM-dependent methyltransferase